MNAGDELGSKLSIVQVSNGCGWIYGEVVRIRDSKSEE